LQIDVRNCDSRRLIEPDAKTRVVRGIVEAREARAHFRCASPSEQNGTETQGNGGAEPPPRHGGANVPDELPRDPAAEHLVLERSPAPSPVRFRRDEASVIELHRRRCIAITGCARIQALKT